MERIMVMEPDADLQEVLREVLEEEGYGVVTCSQTSLAVELLRLAPHPFVVILSHGGRSQAASYILTAAHTLPAHAYVVLSSRPQQAPCHMNAHTRAYVPVVPMPFDIDHLLAQVAAAQDRLHTLATPLNVAAG